MQKLELQSIQNGVVMEMFDEELHKVLANIEDENTVPNSERSITIKISIKPDKTRRTGEVKIQAASTLAKIRPAESFVLFDKGKDGKFSAYADNPGPVLPGLTGEENITQFQKAANGG